MTKIEDNKTTAIKSINDKRSLRFLQGLEQRSESGHVKVAEKLKKKL
jgi:hypothetical protein